MDPLFVVLVVMGLIFLFLGMGVFVFSALLIISALSLFLVLDFPVHRIGTIAAPIIIRSSMSWELAAIPMFVWMGEMMFRTDISSRLFAGLSPLVRRIPGGLLHTNVAGSALFAAISGSSAATTATVGKITLAELTARGYSRSMSYGSLAGAGSLGLMIPPSIVMIVYGVLAEVSISRLFAAGVFPGLMIALLFSGYIAVAALLNKSLTPQDEPPVKLAEVLAGLIKLLPLIALMVIVLGLIYTGIATPSESAAVGVFATVVLIILTRQFKLGVMREALMASVVTSCMICSILISASFLSTAMGYLHVPQNVAQLISEMDLGPYQLIFVLMLFYLILGFFLEGVSITVMSLPITLPLVVGAGFDPVWFGVFLIIMVEMAQITPPVGFSLFIIQGLTRTSIGAVAKASAPFFLLMCIATLLMLFYPQIALWLPDTLYNK